MFPEYGTPCILKITTSSVFFEDITINKRLFFTHFLLQPIIAFLKKSRYGCDPDGKFKSLDMVVVLLAYLKNPDMVVVLLVYLKVQIWLTPCWHIKNPDMVDVLLVHKKSRYSGCLVGTSKSPDMVDALLAHKKSRYG